MTRFTSLVIRSLVTLLIGSATLAVSLHAQTDAITVSVPFPFTVGAQSLAPGTYQFSLQSSQQLLTVINVTTDDQEMFAVLPELQGTSEKHGSLIFRKSQGRSVLSEVHFPGSDEFSEVIRPRHAATIRTLRASTDNSPCIARR